MGLDKSSTPDWVRQPPAVLDIVTCQYPETNPKGAEPALRPCLVLRIFRDTETGDFACRVAYGTKNLKLLMRQGRDLIIQNSSDLDAMGLPAATRFAIHPDLLVDLPWCEPPFGCWPGRRHPRIGSLTVDYQKELMWLLHRQTTE